MTATDPLSRAYQLKHLALRNRIMSGTHEPACSGSATGCPAAEKTGTVQP